MDKIKILLVDDEDFNFELLTLSLGERYEIVYAATGQEALQKTIECGPDVLLLDVCMPGLDGYDTCRLLKNTPETNRVPIIMLSGLETETDKKEGFAAGCDDYITKPFDMSDLIEKIERYSKSNKRK